jgi:xanthine/CO dehydrogenase XdhC/CoxF family maturation factor
MSDPQSKTLLRTIAELERRGVTFAIVTLLGKSGSEQKFVITKDGAEHASGFSESWRAIRDRAQEAIASGRPTVLGQIEEADETYTITIEVIRPKPSVIVFGAGHVGQALSLMASMVGYAVTAIDDREAFANRDRLPDPRITLVAEPFDRAAKAVQITSNTAVVIVTRGHQYDELCLRSVIGSNARYIGMIGSRRRVISVFKQLSQSGVDQKLISRVHAPIGLPISAKSPQEIAVAILAEIIQTFNTQVTDSSD